MNKNPNKSERIFIGTKEPNEKLRYEPFSKRIKLQNRGYHSKLERGNKKIAAMTKKYLGIDHRKTSSNPKIKLKLIEPKHRLSLLAGFSPHQIRSNPISTIKEGDN